MGTVGETCGYLCRGRGQNRTNTGIFSFGVKGDRDGSCRCDCPWHGRHGLLGRSPLLRQPRTTFSLLTFHSTPSSALSDFPLPVFILVRILLCLLSTLFRHPTLVRLASVIFLAIQNVVVVIGALPLLLSSLLMLATLAPQPHSLRAEGFRVGGIGTAVVH